MCNQKKNLNFENPKNISRYASMSKFCITYPSDCRNKVWYVLCHSLCQKNENTYIHSTYIMSNIGTLRKSFYFEEIPNMPKYLKFSDIVISLGYNGEKTSEIVKYRYLKIFDEVKITQENFDKFVGEPTKLAKFFPLFDMQEGSVRDFISSFDKYIENWKGNAQVVKIFFIVF